MDGSQKLLSMAARVALVQSVLVNLPYLLYVPIQNTCLVSDIVDQLVRDFFSGSSEDHRRFHGVKWDHVCLPINFWGPGIGQIRE